MAKYCEGIPDALGRHTASVLPRRAAAIDFCKNTFGAVERVRPAGPDGTAAHALLTIGPAMIMIEAEWPGCKSRSHRTAVRGGDLRLCRRMWTKTVDGRCRRREGPDAGGDPVLGDRMGWSWTHRGTCGRSPRASRNVGRPKEERWSKSSPTRADSAGNRFLLFGVRQLRLNVKL